MRSQESMEKMAEDIINAITVIYGLFQIQAAVRPEYKRVVDEEVNKIVITLYENILYKK